MKYIALLSILAIAACGASGSPIKPAAKTGMTVSGSVTAGIATNGS